MRKLPEKLKRLRKISEIGNWKRYFFIHSDGTWYWKNKITGSILEIHPEYFPNHMVVELNHRKIIKEFIEKGDYRKRDVRWRAHIKALDYAINFMRTNNTTNSIHADEVKEAIMADLDYVLEQLKNF